MKKLYTLMIVLFLMNVVSAQWVSQDSGTEEDLHCVFFTDVNTGYAAGGNGIFIKTNDGGENWIIQDNSMYGSVYEVFFLTDSIGFIGGAEGTFKTIDGGQQWYQVDTLGISEISFADENTGYASMMGAKLSKTIDGGETWTLLDQSSFLIASLFFTSPDTGYFLKPENGIYFTSDGGTYWTKQYDLGGAMPAYLTSMYFTSPDTGFAVGEITTGKNHSKMSAGCIFKTFDGGASWNWEITSDFMNLDIYFTDINTGYIVGYDGLIYKTTNGGDSWTGTTYLAGWDALISVHFPATDTGYTVGTGGNILKTTSGGVVSVDEEKFNTDSFKIYPNPSSTQITIETQTKPQKNTFITIYTLNCQQLITQAITEPQTEIDVSHLPAGIYIVKAWNDKEVMVRKVIKR